MPERRECTASFEVLIAFLAGRFMARSAPEPERIKVAEVEYRVTTEEDFGMDRLSTTSSRPHAFSRGLYPPSKLM